MSSHAVPLQVFTEPLTGLVRGPQSVFKIHNHMIINVITVYNKNSCRLIYMYENLYMQNKAPEIRCAVTVQLISAFVFGATYPFLNPKFKPLAISCGRTAQFVPDPVGNPEVRFWQCRGSNDKMSEQLSMRIIARKQPCCADKTVSEAIHLKKSNHSCTQPIPKVITNSTASGCSGVMMLLNNFSGCTVMLISVFAVICMKFVRFFITC